MNTIGERMTHALKMRGMTQRELANKTRLTEATVSRYVSNQRTPTGKHIKTLCKALGVSADWLLGVNEENS